MATQVRETKAGQSISAWEVLKKGVHIATVNAHYSDGGRVTVDVWNIGTAAVEACRVSALRSGWLKPEKFVKAVEQSKTKRHDWGEHTDHEGHAAYDLFGLQQGYAGGGGYDKLTAALAGIWIDGEQLANHCGGVANAEKQRAALFKQYCKFHDFSGERARAAEKGWDRKYWDKRAERIGASFANWSTEANRYTSLYFCSGLDRLTRLGYQVIQVI